MRTFQASYGPQTEKTEGMSTRLNSLIDLHQKTQNQPVAFCYRGPFLDRFTHTILEIYESTLSARQHQPVVNRKVSFLLVECFQNILRHGETVAGNQPNFSDDGLFSFRSAGDEFIINSINVVPRCEIEALGKLMKNVNSLDADALKELYLQQLNSATFSAKGGAGLGLIELARKSGREVLYEFADAPDERSFFHQQVTFCTNKEKSHVSNWIKETQSLYDQMTSENTLLHYKGDFSQKSVLPLLDMVEHNISSGMEISSLGRRTGHVLIEVLQNISKHGGSEAQTPEGLFTIGWNDGRILLQAGNVITEEEKNFLQEKLEYLRDLDHDDLRELHKAALRASLKFENKNKSGLGLIEVARASSAPLVFQFKSLSSHNHLFALQVAI